MTASLRILVVNSAPFPRLSHALCANMRDAGIVAMPAGYGRYTALTFLNAFSYYLISDYRAQLSSTPEYRVMAWG